MFSAWIVMELGQSETKGLLQRCRRCKILVDSMRTDKRLSKGSYFYYSFIMATIYEYVPANFDVYCALRDVYNGLDSLDADTRYMAIFFLKRGKERGDSRCEKELKQIEKL